MQAPISTLHEAYMYIVAWNNYLIRFTFDILYKLFVSRKIMSLRQRGVKLITMSQLYTSNSKQTWNLSRKSIKKTNIWHLLWVLHSVTCNWSSYHEQYGFYVIVDLRLDWEQLQNMQHRAFELDIHDLITSRQLTFQARMWLSPHSWVSKCPVSTVAGNNINSNNINYPDSDVLHVQQPNGETKIWR